MCKQFGLLFVFCVLILKGAICSEKIKLEYRDKKLKPNISSLNSLIRHSISTKTGNFTFGFYFTQNQLIFLSDADFFKDLKQVDLKREKNEVVKKAEYLELRFGPNIGRDDSFSIYIGQNGGFCDSVNRAGNKEKFDWTSDVAIEITEKGIIEIKVPIKNILLHQVHNQWKLDLVIKEKTDKNRFSLFSWSKIKSSFWDVSLFNKIEGKDYKEREASDDETRGLIGATAILKSADIYYKAINNLGRVFPPEGCRIDGDTSDNRHAPIPQYPVKADGYYRLFLKTGLENYKDIAHQLIDKLIKIHTDTQDGDGDHLVIWNNLSTIDGEEYDYDSGPRNSRWLGTRISTDQSKHYFSMVNQSYPDGFGQGFLDMSDYRDQIDPEYLKKIQVIMEGAIRFCLKEKNLLKDVPIVNFNSIKLSNFELLTNRPIDHSTIHLLGQDIVYLIIAYHKFDFQHAEEYLNSLIPFWTYYLKERPLYADKYKSVHRLFALDDRVSFLYKYTKEKKLTSHQKLWEALEAQPDKYLSKNEPVVFNDDGKTAHGPTTIPNLNVYYNLNQKELARDFILRLFGSLSEDGILSGDRAMSTNTSNFPLLAYHAIESFRNGVISQKERDDFLMKVYNIYGNSKLLRDEQDWVNDIPELERQEEEWSAVPNKNFTANILSEGVYQDADTQAFIVSWGGYHHKKFEHRNTYILKNVYHQYCAPFQYHADRFSYGLADTFNLLDTSEVNKLLEKKVTSLKCSVRLDEEQKGMQLYGILEVKHHNLNWNSDKIELKINGRPTLQESYIIYEYDRILGSDTTHKLLFKAPVNESIIEIEIQIHE